MTLSFSMDRPRRSFWLLALLLGLVPATALARSPNVRPNILLIITDQQQAAMMSCEGEKFVRTPALDQLAAAGTRFRRAYAANPVCIPSRVSMMTGRMPSYYGMRSNDEGRQKIPESELDHTLGRLFRQAGYRTVYGGKTHWFRNMNPESIGFETLTRDQRDTLADRCAEFLAQPQERPFLLVASFINPHDICYMAIDAWTKAKGKEPMYGKSVVERRRLNEALQIPEGVSRSRFFSEFAPPVPANYDVPVMEPERVTTAYLDRRGFRNYARSEWSDEQWRLHRWAYRRLTERVDGQIGNVLDALNRSGLDKSTVVVFTSDHGDHDGSHRLEHKSIPYEEAARVPLIISGPGLPRQKIDETHLINTGLDLIPTLCDFASIEPPADSSGHSWRALLAGDKNVAWPDQVVVETRAGRMLRTDRFKYIVYDQGRNREQLIDLEADPGEMHNLAGKREFLPVLNEHRARLARWVLDTNDRIAAEYIVRSPEK